MFSELKMYNLNEKKIRLGSKSDGGYVVLKKYCKNIDFFYSFGVEDNIDFETSFEKIFSPKQIQLYDHTIKKYPTFSKKMNFFKKGLSNKPSKKFISLDQLIFISNNNFLKMDIEYDEWEVFNDVKYDTLLRFQQIVCEFHFFFLDIDDIDQKKILTPYFREFTRNNYKKINKMLFHKYETVLKKINNYFYIFHLSANNSLPKKNIFGKSIPQLLEISFLRKDLVRNVKEFKGSLPIKGLDYPNKNYKPDIYNFYPI